MKPSNIRTPRTQADCCFVQGYPIIERPMPRRPRIVAALQALALFAVLAGIGVLLAWRG